MYRRSRVGHGILEARRLFGLLVGQDRRVPRQKTAVTIHYGLYQFVRMPFRLKDLPRSIPMGDERHPVFNTRAVGPRVTRRYCRVLENHKSEPEQCLESTHSFTNRQGRA